MSTFQVEVFFISLLCWKLVRTVSAQRRRVHDNEVTISHSCKSSAAKALFTTMRNQLLRIAQLSGRQVGATRSISSGFGLPAKEFSSSQGNRKFGAAPDGTRQLFEGKVAVVTGGASGIGEATVRKFVREGARVLIADVQDALGKKLAEELGPATQFVHTDVTKEEDVAGAVDAAFALEGHLDIMVNNAGILGAFGAIDQVDMAEYDYTVAVNTRGVVLGVKHAARVMKPAQKGSIVCTGSISAVQGGRGPHCYTISKTGLIGLVRSAAFELRNHGVRINMVSPDGVPTPLAASAVTTLSFMPDEVSVETSRQNLAAQTSIKAHPLTPDGVADAIAFLAGDGSSYITGHNLMVDGGVTTFHHSSFIDEWFKAPIPILREGGIRGLSAA